MAKQQYVLNDAVWIPIGGAPGEAGPPGQDGAPGADGAPGSPGPPGVAYLYAQWNFNQNTAVSPASGTMRMNATTYAATTTLWVNETDRDGLDRTVGLDLITDGDHIIMQSAQGRVEWLITGHADSGTYRTLTVTMVDSTGSRPSASSVTTLYFASGTAGSSGGTTILDGTATPTGATGAVDDYYLDTDDNILYGPKLAAPYLPSKSLFTTETPTGSISSAAGTWSFGMGITCTVSGRVTGVRYYRPATSSSVASTTMTLWSDSGVLLATGTTTVDTVGWITVTFPSPVLVTAGQKVWPVLYGSTTVDQQCGRTTALTPMTNGNLSNGAGNGFYKFGAPHGMPTSSENRSYFVDVVFEADGTYWPVALYGAAGQSTILSGTATPAAGTGAVGDYYLDTDDRILYGPKAAATPSYGAAQSVFTGQAVSNTNTVNMAAGNMVTVAVAGRITGIRYYRNTNNGASHTFRLWSDAGVLLGTATSSGETGVGWVVTAPLATPVTVAAGQVVCASVDLTSQYLTWGSGTATVTNNNLTISGSSRDGAVGTFPTNPESAIRYFVDLVFEPDTTPSSWPVALYGAAGQSTILSGTATPTSLVGNIGNYYLDTDDRVLYGPKDAGLMPLEYTSPATSLAWDGPNMLGMRHRFATNGTVVGVRFQVPATAVPTGTWEVYLFTNAGALLASKDVATPVAGTFVDAYFDTPVAVSASVTYVSAVWVSGVKTEAYLGSAAATLVSGNVTQLATGVDGNSGVTASTRDEFPWANAGWTFGVSPLFRASGATSGWPVALYGKMNTWTGTQAAYDAISPKDSNTIYVVV